MPVETFMMASGKMTKPMAKEFTFKTKAADMKANGSMTNKMAMEKKSGQMAPITKEITKTAKNTAMEE